MKAKERKNLRVRKSIWLSLLAISCLVIITLVTFLFFITPPSKTSYKGPVEKISTGVVGEYAALVFIAEQQGFFRNNGLDVDIVDYPAGPPALTDLLSGKLTTAVASDFAGVRNSFNNEDLKMVATVSKSEAFFLVSRKDHGIVSPKDLKGKHVGLTQKTVGEFYLGLYLAFNGVSPKDVRTSNMPQADLVNAVATGAIDAAVVFEPNAHKARTALGSNASSWSVQNGQLINSILFSTGTTIRERPDALRRFVQALKEAEDYIKDYSPAARETVAKRLKYDDTYMDVIWPNFTFALSLDQELILNMEDEARWAVQNRVVTATEAPNYLRMMYFDALEKVKPEGVTVIR